MIDAKLRYLPSIISSPPKSHFNLRLPWVLLDALFHVLKRVSISGVQCKKVVCDEEFIELDRID